MKARCARSRGLRYQIDGWCGDMGLGTWPKAALSHRLTDKAAAAYARGDMLAKRAALMAGWATACSPGSPLS
ncbi:MAG: hypothetical protein ACJAVR_002913 [Paracoccaceae bacterium]|jgi:hypothetical protein